MASRWGHGSLRLLEQAVCELGLAEQGRQGEKSVCLEPSPVLWDLANHEARKGGGTRHGRWHATGPGYPAGSRDWPWPLPRHSPGGMARRGDASGEAPEAVWAARGKALGADSHAFTRHEHAACCAPAPCPQDAGRMRRTALVAAPSAACGPGHRLHVGSCRGHGSTGHGPARQTQGGGSFSTRKLESETQKQACLIWQTQPLAFPAHVI